MVDLKISINPVSVLRLEEFLQLLQDEGILTDYHGLYPEALVINIRWLAREGDEPLAQYTQVAVRMPTDP